VKSSDRVAIGEQLSGWLINACVKLVGGDVVLRDDMHEYITSRVQRIGLPQRSK
jgi:hypothetical protein